MIRVTLYSATGNVQSRHDCHTTLEAFNRLQRSNMHGIAHPTDTSCGCYTWEPSKEHTLEGFEHKLSLCCNSAAEYTSNLINEYTSNLIKAGILR